jgi:hypothetical protein
MSRYPFMLRAACVLAGCTALGAQAHDTWFAVWPAVPGSPNITTSSSPPGTLLALGTGNQFPVMDTPMAASSLVFRGCADSSGRALPLPAQSMTAQALQLLAPAPAHTCWAQSQAFEVTVPPALVPVYLKEIEASAAVRAAWSQMQQRGLPWQERYVKHARIELNDLSRAASSTPLAMDVQLLSNGQPLRGGSLLIAVVTRDGQPLADQAIELRSDTSKLGFWRRSDAQGRVQFTLPKLAATSRWILRGTDLRVSTSNPDTWDSRFITVAFDVAATL